MVGDVSPPQIVNLTVEARAVDTTSSSVAVPVGVQFVDDLSGVSSCQLAFNPSNSSYTSLTAWIYLSDQSARVAGTSLNGTWTGKLQIARFSPRANYTLVSVSCT